MKKILALVTILCVITSSLIGQKKKGPIIFQNSEKISKYRYRDIKGSPYIFEDWVYANIISTNIEIFEDMRVNYNGHTKSFEVIKGQEVIDLDERWYMRVEIYPEKNPSLVKDFGEEKIIFQRDLHPKMEAIFGQLVYGGGRLTLFKTYHADLSKKKIEDVGKTLEFQRFVGKYTYYMIKDGKLTTVSTKKKSMLKALGKHPEIDDYIKKEKIDFRSEADLCKLMAFVEENRF